MPVKPTESTRPAYIREYGETSKYRKAQSFLFRTSNHLPTHLYTSNSLVWRINCLSSSLRPLISLSSCSAPSSPGLRRGLPSATPARRLFLLLSLPPLCSLSVAQSAVMHLKLVSYCLGCYYGVIGEIPCASRMRLLISGLSGNR
jgi:hypothetical protein